MKVTAYLSFEGRCEEAIEFYKQKLGAKVGMLMRFSDSPEPPREGCTPSSLDKVMHASFTIGDSLVMASDGMANGKPEFKGFALSLNARDEADANKLFAALSDGGNVLQPLIKTFFSPAFGMVTDKFGICWMIVVEP